MKLLLSSSLLSSLSATKILLACVIITGLLTTAILLTPSFAAKVEITPASNSKYETAIFAGGCFWCMEPPFDKLDGVISTISGYTSGHKDNPDYSEVSAGSTGHTEAIEITFDPTKVSYTELLEVFWRNIDPIAVNQQFCDIGTQYRSGIYYRNASQEKAARQSFKQLQKSIPFTDSIATEIVAASAFYPAEDYHQDYYQKNPVRYKFYRYRCGRDQRLEELWGQVNE